MTPFFQETPALNLRSTIAATVLTLATLAGASATEMPPIRGGTMTYGRYADSLLLDPVLNDSNTDIWILSNLYDTLLLPTDDGLGVRPGLASAWQVAPGGLTVTLTLRPGTRFSDGAPITAADVKWSLDRARNPGFGIWSFLLGAIGTVEIAAPDTILLHLRQPDPAILAALSVFNSAIMPERPFEAQPGATDHDKAVAFEQHPVTSGPFVLKSWTRGALMHLVRNPFYWQPGADGRPLPYLDGIDFELVPDDATRMLKVQSGELDGAELVPFSRVAELRRDARLRVELFPATREVFAVLNARPHLPDGRTNPLASAAVREALNDAVDRTGLIAIVTHGLAVPMTSFISRATPMHIDVPGATTFDLARARALLRAAGYPNGFAATMNILAGNEDDIEIGTALQEMWSAIGIDLHLRQLDAATHIDLYRKGAFTTSLEAWTDDIADPEELASYAVYNPTNDAQHTGWHDAVAEQLFLASSIELDAVKRAADYARIQQIFTDGPVVRLFETPYAVVLRRTVTNFRQLPLGNNIFDAVWLAR